MQDSKRPHSIFWPLLLIAAGVFLLFNALGFIPGDFWGVFARLWPLLFIAGGLDSLYRRENYVGPILFIGVGAVILLSNLGYLAPASWTVFLRLWPVLLIAFGLDILIGHRTLWSAVIGVFMGLVLVGAVLWYTFTLPEIRAGVRSETIAQQLTGANRAEVNLNQIFGEMVVRSGAQTGRLVDGEVQLGRNQTFFQDYEVINGRGIFTLDGAAADTFVPFLNPATSLVWHLNLTGAIPLHLTTDLVMGSQNIDVSGLDLESYESNVVFGQNTLTLSDDTRFEGRVSAVFGEVIVYVPRDVPLRMQLDTAFTATSFPAGFTRQEDVVYNQAAGMAGDAIELEVNVPFGSVRIVMQEE